MLTHDSGLVIDGFGLYKLWRMLHEAPAHRRVKMYLAEHLIHDVITFLFALQLYSCRSILVDILEGQCYHVMCSLGDINRLQQTSCGVKN